MLSVGQHGRAPRWFSVLGLSKSKQHIAHNMFLSAVVSSELPVL